MTRDEPRFRSLSRDERRERILWAAKRVLLEKGLDEASMDDVAACAGTTKPTVYAHFKSKDELFSAVVEYVRGLFQGWAFVNLERIEKTDGQFLFPGNSVLSTLHHPVIGPLTNAFFTGSFKGKVLDWDGDGVLDLNYLPSYATVDGEVDSDLDGRPDVPGMTMSRPRPAAPII